MNRSELAGRLQPRAHEFIARLLRDPAVETALDIGCGPSSYLSAFRPRIKTVGIDAFEGAISEARRNNVHDDYILGDIIATSVEGLLARNGGKPFQLVTLFDVIEHVPKRLGWELLEKCEQLTSAFVMVQTPFGFVEQGPEFGNKYQRHLSGWFPHDFEGFGYKVAGCAGSRLFHGYGGAFRWSFPGVKLADFVWGMLVHLEKRPHYALNFVAWKDIRGVPARLSETKPTAD